MICHNPTLTHHPHAKPSTSRAAWLRRRLGELLAKLDRIGSADAIAEFLAREGILGTPQHGRICALAKWLKTGTGEEIYVSLGAVGYLEHTASRKLPAPLQEFQWKFDRHLYPGLVDPAPQLTAFEIAEANYGKTS